MKLVIELMVAVRIGASGLVLSLVCEQMTWPKARRTRRHERFVGKQNAIVVKSMRMCVIGQDAWL